MVELTETENIVYASLRLSAKRELADAILEGITEATSMTIEQLKELVGMD